MKCLMAAIDGRGRVRAVKRELESLKPGQVRVRVHASLISPGTEMNAVKTRRAEPDEGAEEILFGYANAGEITEVAEGVEGLEVGQRVAAMGGGFARHAEWSNVPQNLVAPLPEKVTWAQANYACLAATSLQSVRRTDPKLGEFGVVAGQGIVGNLAAQLYQLCGARVLGWDTFESRIRIAKKCGVGNVIDVTKVDPVEATKKFAAPWGLDFANVAFGGQADKPVGQLIECMKVSPDTHQMGRIVLVGGCRVDVGGGAYSGNLDFRASSRTGPGYHDPAWEVGADYPECFVQFTTQRNLREIVRLIEEGRLVVDPMTTHEMPLSRVGTAANLLVKSPQKALGIVLTMG